MGSVALEGFGGGSNPLNFKIVSYATEEELLAATPKENTIGIVTTDTITSWIFSATEPTDPVEGMVWITTGTSSALEFNALKKNGIQVYPISAKQYVNGAWVGRPAKSYQNGAWVDLTPFLLKNGVISDILGGFNLNANATFTNGVLHTIYANGKYGNARGKKNMDLKHYSTLHAMVRQTNATNALDMVFGIAQNANDDNNYIASTQVTVEVNDYKEFTVNLEGVDSGYFKMVSLADAYINEIWLT